MPVRSLTSSVLRWPDRGVVDRAVPQWGARVASAHPETVRIGYFGSYARRTAGVGSDVDLVVIVERAAEPFAARARSWDATELPVPADVVVYTTDEWAALRHRRFGATIVDEAVWVYVRPTCRAPATTWMNRRGSASRRSSSAPCGRRKGTSCLLILLSSFTQRRE